MSAEHDLVIRGGTIIDGSGAATFEGDVAIDGGKITAVGKIAAAGREEIDARGKIVTPGFVDIHTHYDGQITWENRLAPSSDHGVTSVVMGNCGVGFAPARPNQHELMIRLMEGVEDIPDVVMATGIPWNWESFPDYLDALAQRRSDIDFAAQLPHSPLRVYVMGERGANLEPPTEADLKEMRRLTAEALNAGAIGVSTSRNLSHRFRSGALAPSVPTEDTEILNLAAGLRDAGKGVFQLVPDTHLTAQQQLNLLRGIARSSGRPVSFTLMEIHSQPEVWRVLLDGLADANAEGEQIRGQVIPRPTGALLGLELSLHPFSFNPSYRAIEKLPFEDKLAAMRDPEMRAKLLAEEPSDPHDFFKFVISDLEKMFELGDPPNYHPEAADSIAAKARAAGRSVKEVMYDALLARGGKAILYRPISNYGGERFENAGRNMLKNDFTVLGLGDGGAHYSMICDAAYPTYFLTYWSRDASTSNKVELPDAIHMLARKPAVAVGLMDRGLVKAGYKADLNVIDLGRLHLHAPHATYDLPAGGRRLSQRADGYEATIVSGDITYRQGKATGALPGRLQRGAQPAPAKA